MTGFIFAALLAAAPATALSKTLEKLQNLEVNCWHKGIEDGAFRCSYVMIMGKSSADGRQMVPELLAPDEGGPRTREQARRACRAMGFDYASSFALEEATKPGAMVTIDESLREGELHATQAKFIQHLSCE